MPAPSRDEVVKAIQQLEIFKTRPCNCEANGHGEQCDTGRLMMQASIDALKWTIGLCNILPDMIALAKMDDAEMLAKMRQGNRR